jgi:ribosome-associated protein
LPVETRKEHKVTETKEMAKKAGEILSANKALKVVVLEVQGLTLIADYFVIASAPNQRHVRALVDMVLEGLSGDREPHHIEGYEGGLWVLMDYGDFVVHVFRNEERAFYGLERLWGDAPRVEVGPD